MEAFPGVESGMRSLGNRLRGRQRSSLYQVAQTVSAIMCIVFPTNHHVGDIALWPSFCKGISVYDRVWYLHDHMRCGSSDVWAGMSLHCD